MVTLIQPIFPGYSGNLPAAVRMNTATVCEITFDHRCKSKEKVTKALVKIEMFPSLSWYWVPAALELSPQDIALSSAVYNGIIAQEKHGYWQESEKPP